MPEREWDRYVARYSDTSVCICCALYLLFFISIYNDVVTGQSQLWSELLFILWQLMFFPFETNIHNHEQSVCGCLSVWYLYDLTWLECRKSREGGNQRKLSEKKNAAKSYTWGNANKKHLWKGPTSPTNGGASALLPNHSNVNKSRGIRKSDPPQKNKTA